MSFCLTKGANQEGVTFAYPDGKAVLRDLSFTLDGGPMDKGRTIAMLGPSGLGKTTLLNLLALLWEGGLTSGRITYTSPRTGAPLHYDELSNDQRAQLRREEFGIVPQVSHFLSGFTCRRNLLVPLALSGVGGRAARERVEFLLDKAREGAADNDLRGTLDKYPMKVSTGQRQRLAVLRAVAHDPVVLFADEPVSNLDAHNKDLMLRLFRRWLTNGLRLAGKPESPRLLLLICHEAETAWEMADQYLFLQPSSSQQPAGATAELIPHGQFAERYGLAPERESAALALGAEAIRRYLRGELPLPAPVAAPALVGGES